MSITIEQIDLWRATLREHQNLEFKEAKNQFDTRRLCQYCVALANEGGGQMLLGIADQPPHAVVGSNAFLVVNDIAEKLFEWLRFRVDVDAVDHPDGRVVVFTIPSRPRGTAYHHDGRYLMRSGEELVSMSEDRLRHIFDEGKPDWLEEPSLSDLSAEQVVELLDVQTFFELKKIPYPTDQVGVIERLRSEGLIQKEAAGFSIKRLGAVLMARRLSDFPDVKRKAARVVVYSGLSKANTRLDQDGGRGYLVGFQGLVQFVMAQLPQNEVVEKAFRREEKLVPEIVVRELIANALIHQDFSVTGASVMIEIYNDRLEISNPGEPIIPIEKFIDGYRSRNERLADFARRLGICEEKGSGIDKVVSQVEFSQLPAPEFTATHGRTVVIVHGHQPFESMNRSDRLRACYQHACLRYVTRQYMTNRSLRERFGLGEDKVAVASQLISSALQEKLIKPDAGMGESRRHARYLPFWA